MSIQLSLAGWRCCPWPRPYDRRFSQKALATIFASELRKHRIAAVAITPGFLRSERMLEHFGVTEENWRDAGKKDKNFLESESPLFVGRAVAALAQDRHLLNRSGHLFSSWELGRQYGFTDVDGCRPDWGALEVDFSRLPASLIEAIADALYIQGDWLNVLAHRTERYQASVAAFRNASTVSEVFAEGYLRPRGACRLRVDIVRPDGLPTLAHQFSEPLWQAARVCNRRRPVWLECFLRTVGVSRVRVGRQ